MMNSKKRIKVTVPASTANSGSGFDCIGIALQLYTKLDMSEHDKLQFDWLDEEGVISPFPFTDNENLILQAMQKICEIENKDIPNVRIIVQSNIPSTRGLGSSASAYIAGLVAMNEWFGGPISNDELLWLAAENEGHADNVGASLFGGVFIGAMDWEHHKVYYNTIPFPDHWTWLAAIPSYSLSTAVARDLLPQDYKKQDVLFNLSRYGLLVASFQLGDEDGVRAGLLDKLHQPYRQHLVPGFEQLVETRDENDALGFVISGAGPTILGLFPQHANLLKARQHMEQVLKVEPHKLHVIPLAVDHSGVQVIKN